MFRRTAGLALALFLVLPGAAFAAEPKPDDLVVCADGTRGCVAPAPPGTDPGAPTGHYYYVAAIEQGGKTVKVEGKLWIEGTQLGASVGCNSIGARATFDGRTLTIREALVTTEMACDGQLASVERALLNALGAGPFTWDGSGFKGKDARIVANVAGATPAEPPDGSGGEPKPDPGGVIGPDPGINLEDCRKFFSASEWDAIFGPATGSGGSTGSGGGSSGGGSGGGTEPGMPPVVDPDPGPNHPVDPGTGVPTEPTPTKPAPPDPAPPAPTPTAPVSTAPAPSSTPTPVEGTGSAVAPDAADQPLAVDLPATTRATDGGPTRLPVKIADRPSATPSAESCRELVAKVRTMTMGGGAMPPVSSDGKAEAAGGRDLAANAAASATVDPAIVLILVLAGGVLLLVWIRSIPARRVAA